MTTHHPCGLSLPLPCPLPCPSLPFPSKEAAVLGRLPPGRRQAAPAPAPAFASPAVRPA